MAIALTFFAGLFATSLVTWLGCRVTALMGGAICAISLVVSSFANDMTILLFSYGILFGFGCSCTFSAGIMVIKLYFSKIQAIAVGVLTSGIGIGALIMSPILETLTRATDWQTTFLIMAGVVFLSSLCTITFDSNVEKDQETTSCNEKEIEQINGERERRSIVSEMQRVFDVSVWKELPVVVFFLPEFFVAFGHFVPQLHLVRADKKFALAVYSDQNLISYLNSQWRPECTV